MALGYLLLLLVPIAAIAYILWDYQRKTNARNAAAEGRLQDLLTVTKPLARTDTAPPAPPAAPAASPPVAPAPAVAPAAPIAADAALYAARGRVLNPAQTLLYLLLKTALPDYVVLARVPLGTVIEPGPGLTGLARDEQVRLLSLLTVDFVVAEKSMRPVVVIELASTDDDGGARGDRQAARARVGAAGVRYLELDAKRLPRRDAIRAVVLAEPATEIAQSEAGVTG